MLVLSICPAVALFGFVRIPKDYLTCLLEKEHHLYSYVKLLVMADDQPQAPAHTFLELQRSVLTGQPASPICRSN